MCQAMAISKLHRAAKKKLFKLSSSSLIRIENVFLLQRNHQIIFSTSTRTPPISLPTIEALHTHTRSWDLDFEKNPKKHKKKANNKVRKHCHKIAQGSKELWQTSAKQLQHFLYFAYRNWTCFLLSFGIQIHSPWLPKHSPTTPNTPHHLPQNIHWFVFWQQHQENIPIAHRASDPSQLFG